jgi:hypothetical protein
VHFRLAEPAIIAAQQREFLGAMSSGDQRKLPFGESAKITYPPGQSFKPKVLPEEISVYEGQASIKIELPRGSLAAAPHPPVNVEVQACNLEICLPPATLAVPLGKC